MNPLLKNLFIIKRSDCDAIGQLVAEYSTQLSQTPNTSYMTADHLNSPRIQTSATGQVISRHDYEPFGEEIQRANYGADDTRKKFTGYERDSETNLDYAQARYYQSQHGRFSTVDPVMLSSERILTPQSINLYVYVRNNPLRYIDPLGLDITIADKTKDGSGSDEYKNLVNGRKNGKFTVGYDDKNKLVIVDEEGKALSKDALETLGKSLKGSEKALFKAITDDKKHATVNLVRDDANVFIGAHEGRGQNTIDLGDISKISNGNVSDGLSQFDFIGHETLESYFSVDNDEKQAHGMANEFHPGLSVPELNTGHNNVNGSVTKGVVWFPIVGRTDVAQQVVFVLVNPVPVGTYKPSLTGVNVESLSTIPKSSVPPKNPK